MDVLRLCQDPESDLSALAERLSVDPVLAGRVLRMANSAAYNRGTEVTSLNRAAVMLGLRTLKVLALGFTLANELPHEGKDGGFDLQVYWHRSLVNAVAARAIAGAVTSRQREEAFIGGLLSGVGKLAMARVDPEMYSAPVERSGGWPTDALEREMLGFSSGEVCGALLKAWGLPETIAVAASHAERPDALPADAPPETRELTNLISVGTLAGDVSFDADPAATLARLHVETDRLYGLTAEATNEVLEGLHYGILDSAETFAVELPPGRTYSEILDEARSQLVAVTLNTMLDLEQTSTALAEKTEEAEEMQTRALTDKLTDLPNRAALEEALHREVELQARAQGAGNSLGVMMIDVDKFKTINDTYGHQDGDKILSAVSAAMAGVTRASNLLARYGGDEFCMILPQASHEGVKIAAERVRSKVESLVVPLSNGVEGRLTVSVGAATMLDVTHPNALEFLIEKADEALYQAKANGRNCVEVAPPIQRLHEIIAAG